MLKVLDGIIFLRVIFSSHLFAVGTAWGESSLVTGNTVKLVLIWDEGLSADGLLTAVTNKTFLVPRAAFILQPLRA